MPKGTTSQCTRALPRAIVVLLVLCSGFAVLGWLLYAMAYQQSHAIDARKMFPAGETYVDLTTYIERFDVFGTRAFFQLADESLHRSRFAYPPAAAFCYLALYKSHHMKFAYNLVSATTWLSFAAFFGLSLKRAGASNRLGISTLACFVTLSYPAAFLHERANIEIFLWLLIFCGILLYRRRSLHCAAVCFGLAAALKLYPVFLLGLFLSRRGERKALLTGAVTAVLATCASIAASAPGFFRMGALGYLQGITGFQQTYAGGSSAGHAMYDHSLFSWVKLWATHAGRPFSTLIPPYYLACGVGALILFMFRVNRLPTLNRVTFLLVLLISLPPVSFEYTVVHLYLPAALLILAFLTEGAGGDAPPTAALACLLLLLLPIDLLGPVAGYAGQIQVALLLAVLFLAAWKPWTWQDLSQNKNAVCVAGCNETALA